MQTSLNFIIHLTAPWIPFSDPFMSTSFLISSHYSGGELIPVHWMCPHRFQTSLCYQPLCWSWTGMLPLTVAFSLKPLNIMFSTKSFKFYLACFALHAKYMDWHHNPRLNGSTHCCPLLMTSIPWSFILALLETMLMVPHQQFMLF